MGCNNTGYVRMPEYEQSLKFRVNLRWTGLVDVFGEEFCEDTFPVLFSLYENVVLGGQKDNLDLAEQMFEQWEKELNDDSEENFRGF